MKNTNIRQLIAAVVLALAIMISGIGVSHAQQRTTPARDRAIYYANVYGGSWSCEYFNQSCIVHTERYVITTWMHGQRLRVWFYLRK